MICPINMSTGLMASAINSVAYNAYVNHTSGTKFTLEEQKAIYKTAIDTIAEDFYSGDITKVLAPIVADPNLESHAAMQNLFNQIFRSINTAFDKISEVDTTRKKIADEFEFPVQPAEIRLAVFKEYLDSKKGKISSIPIQEEPVGNADDMDEKEEPKPLFKDVETKSALLKRVFSNERDRKYITPITKLLKDTVSKTWVDGFVRPDGSVRGFTNLKDVAKTVKFRLQSRIFDYFVSRSAGSFRFIQNGKETKYIVFTPDKVPIDSTGTLVQIPETNVMAGKIAGFETIQTTGKEDKVAILVAPSLDEAIAVMSKMTKVMIKEAKPNSSDKTDFTEISFTNSEQLDEQDLPAFFAHILTSGDNFDVFVKSEFPMLSSDYKEKFKTSYEEPGTVSGSDQDSAALKLHKQTTPRLVVGDYGLLHIDQSSPYLTTTDFTNVAPELSSLPPDLPGMMRKMNDPIFLDSIKSDYKRNTLISIYNRFFNLQDYDVVDSEDSSKTVKMRSYAGIAMSQRAEKLSVDEYMRTRGKNAKSSNVALESSVSALVTSFRSIKPNEQVGELNGNLQLSNITGSGRSVFTFNTDFLGATTTSTAAGTFTQNKYLDNGRVRVEILKHGTTPRIRLTIFESLPGEKINELTSSISYEADVNLTQKDDQTVEFTNGIPLTIVNRTGSNTSREQIAKIFAKFGLPNAITNPKYLPQVESIVDNFKGLKNEKAQSIVTADGTTINTGLENIYVNMLFTMILNGKKTLDPVSTLRLLPLPAPQKDSTVAYNPMDLLHGYKELLADVILHTEGELSSNRSMSYKGTRLSDNVPASMLKRTGEYAAAASETGIHAGNVLTPSNEQYTIGTETRSLKGIKIGDESKENAELTLFEKLTFSIETAYLQTIKKSTNNSSTLIQPGAQSDRLHPQTIPFISKDAHGIMKREDELGGFSRKKWEVDSQALLTLPSEGKEPVTQLSVDSVISRNELRKLLANHKFKYEDLVGNTDLKWYGGIAEDQDGYAYVPNDRIEDLGNLDINALERGALFTHQNYYTQLNKVGAEEWSAAISKLTGTVVQFKSLLEVRQYLKEHSLRYADVKALASLTENSFITKDSAGFARVPEDVIQSIFVFSNDTLALDYMETMRRMFLKQLKKEGYTRISPASVAAVQSVMGVTRFDSDDARNTQIASNVLFNSYFYNGQILGVSALNILTGGVEQYDLKSKSYPFFAIEDFADANNKINAAKIVAKAKSLSVPGSKETLGAISVQSLLELREKEHELSPTSGNSFKLNRLVYMKAILENPSFKDERTKARALLLNDLTRHLHDKFVSQVKRNAVLGTAMQLPRLAGRNEPGFMLGATSKSIAVRDPEVEVNILGTSGTKEVTATDGVMMIHPLHAIRLNNSVGNEESSYRIKGVAAKDLTISKDRTGATKIQKKASFSSFMDDLVKKGSAIADGILEKMNTAVSFPSKQMVVFPKGQRTFAPITLDSWKIHGLSYGFLKYSSEAGDVMVDTHKILYQLKNSPAFQDQFEQDLLAGKYQTDKVEETFENLQELWEYFGAHTNPEAWNEVAELLGYHSGIGTASILLDDALYPNRDAYIEKVGYVSQEKSGQQNAISYENMLDRNSDFIGKWSEVSNDSHGLILQAEHNYDTTAKTTGLASIDNEEMRESHVSLITQIISASSAEGMSPEEAGNISTTIGTLTEASLDGLRNRVVAIVIKNHPELASKREALVAALKRGVSEDSTQQYAKELLEASEEYARDLISRSLAKKESDGGLAAELLTVHRKAKLTFDQKQLLPLFQSQLFAAFNKEAVRMKMAGGQYVVSPSHTLLPTYDLTIGSRTLLSGLNREEMNKYFYGKNYRNASALQKAAINESFPLEKITDLNKVKLSDIVVSPKGEELQLHYVKEKAKELYKTTAKEVPFKQFFNDFIIKGEYLFRFGNIDAEADQHKNRLKWAQWLRYDANGNEVNALDTPEFKAFNLISKIGKDFASGLTFDKSFKLDLTKPMADANGVPGLSSDIINKIPISLVREYYFGAIDPSTKGKARPAEFLAPVQENAFKEWLRGTNILETLAATYQYLGERASVDPLFKKNFEIPLYNLLQDESKGWVSIPAETYMPHMHASEFLLHDGLDGQPADSLFDIIGLNAMPSTSKLESLKILSHQEAVAFAFDYDRAYEKFTSPTGKYRSLPDAHKTLFNDYVESVTKMRDHMTAFFKERVEDLYGMDYKSGADHSKLAEPANLFVFDDTESAHKMINSAIRKRNALQVGSKAHAAMVELIQELENNLALADANLRHEFPHYTLEKIRNKFVNEKVASMTKSFLKTLDFIMARIPAQGKQSFIHARIKNLIFSSKNSVYGPLELVLVAGLDYDIDKQNMMTWALNDDGEIVDWVPFMKDGKLSIDKLNEKIKENTKALEMIFSEDRARIEKRLEGINKQIEEAPVNGEEATKLSAKRDAIINALDNLDSKLQKAIENSERSTRVLFNKAGQNFITHNLIEVISSPKNAIEANTPIGMAKIQSSTTLPDVKSLFTDKIDLEDIFISQQITSNVNPFSTFEYEKINMDGKSGIGIFASDLKAYLATFYATRTATEEENKHVKLKSDLPKLPLAAAEAFGIDGDALQFFKAKYGPEWIGTKAYQLGDLVRAGKYSYMALKDVPEGTPIKSREHWKLAADVTTMPFVANATRWSNYGQNLSKEARSALEQIKRLDPNDTDGQFQILEKYADKVHLMNSMSVEEQAWEGLSELLTASTDNAKELILGKIGANNTTSGLISTMVRMGVDLKDAIRAINNEKVTAIVKDIELGNDLKVKSEANRALAMSGVVKEDAFNKKLAERLKEKLPEAPGQGASDEMVFDYLTDPIRQLYTYSNIAAEFGLLAKLLSINQGLKNSAFEVYSYVTSLNDAVNKSITDYNSTHKDSPIELEFDLEKFVYDVSEKNMSNVNKLLDAMDKVRSGLNVPYILLKNKHYFGYFEAMFQAQNIRDRVSFTNRYTSEIIDAAKRLYGKRSITEKVFKSISDTMYDFGVLNYLEHNNGADSPLMLRGVTYDLSKPEARADLLAKLPSILKEHNGNPFVDAMKYDRSEIDKMTGIDVKIIKGPDLSLIDSERFAELTAGLNWIKTNDLELYNALFAYSLITTKGAYASGSFAGLFDVEEYLKFSEFLKAHMIEVKGAIINNKKLIFLQNPILLPQFSTIAQASKKYNAQQDFEDESFSIYEEMGGGDFEDELPGENGLTTRSAYWKNLNKQRFILDHLNAEKRKKNSYITSDFIASKNTGFVYQWNEILQIWVPLIRKAPLKSIPFSLPSTDQDYINLETLAGYTQGFPINLPTVMAPVKMPDGSISIPLAKGNVIAYVTSTMKGAANKSPESMPKKLLDIITRDKRGTDEKIKTYIVKAENGDYSLFTDDELARANPGFVFDEGYIAASLKTLDTAEVKGIPMMELYSKDSKYYRTRVDDSYTKVEGPLNIETRASESNPVQYNPDIMKKVVENSPTSNMDRSYTTVKVNAEYQKYLENLIDNLFALEADKDVEKATFIRKLGASMSRENKEIYRRVTASVEHKLGTNLSLPTKVEILMKGYEGFRDIFYDLGVNPNNLQPSNLTVEFPRALPYALHEFISTNAKDNITRLSTGEFKNLLSTLGVPSSIFDSYIADYLDEFDIDAFIMSDGQVYLKRGIKIAASKKLASVEDKEKKSKPIYLPPTMKYEYQKPASKAVLFAMARFLNSKLPGVQWSIMTQAEIEKKYGAKFATNKAFFKMDGEVIINSDKASLETPIHEFTHVYLQYLAKENPEEYARLMDLASRHSLYKTMSKSYKNISTIDVAEEVFCELVSMAATNKLITTKSGITEDILDGISDLDGPFGKLVKRFKSWIRSMFSVKPDTEIELDMTDSLGTVISKLSDEILYGPDSILNGFSQATKDAVAKSRTASTITIKEARDILLSRGYIQWFCV